MIVFASAIRRRATKYIFHECFRDGHLNLLGGSEGIGKSLLIYMIAAVLARRGVVLLSTAEDDHDEDVGPRLEAAGANLGRIIPEHATRRFPDDADRLADDIEAYGITLAIFEPVIAHMSRASLQIVPLRAFAESLERVAQQTGCTIITTSHLLKSPGRSTSPLHAVLGGAGGLGAVVPSGFLLGRNPHDRDELLLAPIKRRRGAPIASLAFEIDTVDLPASDGQVGLPDVERLVFVGDRDITAEEVLAGMRAGQPPAPARNQKRSAAAEWLTDYLFAAPNHEAPGDVVKEDALQHGHTPATLRRARAQIGVIVDTGKLPGFGTGTTSVWRLPPELAKLKAEQAQEGEEEQE